MVGRAADTDDVGDVVDDGSDRPGQGPGYPETADSSSDRADANGELGQDSARQDPPYPPLASTGRAAALGPRVRDAVEPRQQHAGELRPRAGRPAQRVLADAVQEGINVRIVRHPRG